MCDAHAEIPLGGEALNHPRSFISASGSRRSSVSRTSSLVSAERREATVRAAKLAAQQEVRKRELTLNAREADMKRQEKLRQIEMEAESKRRQMDMEKRQEEFERGRRELEMEREKNEVAAELRVLECLDTNFERRSVRSGAYYDNYGEGPMREATLRDQQKSRNESKRPEIYCTDVDKVSVHMEDKKGRPLPSGEDDLGTRLGRGKDDINKKDSIIEKLVYSNECVRLPKREIEVFGGNIERYGLFKTSFNAVVGSAPISSKEKLHLLYQHTSGLVKRIVETCLYMSDEEGYSQAWKLLDKRYGSAEQVGNAHIEKLLQMGDVLRDDPKALDSFSIELQMARNAVSQLDYGKNELEHPKTIKTLAYKLPFKLQERWRRIATRVVQNKRRAASFEDFLSFVEDEALVANNPLYGLTITTKKGKNERVTEERTRKVIVGTMKEAEKCLFCEELHDSKECARFEKLDRETKIKTLSEMRVCFMCFKAGHMAKACTDPSKCEVCGGWHLTIMHNKTRTKPTLSGRESHTGGTSREVGSRSFRFGARSESNRESTSATKGENRRQDGDKLGRSCVMLSTGSGTLPVIPVEVRSRDGNVVRTSAVLDSGSAITLCSYELVEKLGVKGVVPSDDLTIVTVGGEYSLRDGAVCGLKIRGRPGVDICLPPVYVLDNVPVESADIISKSELGRWEHLKGLDVGDGGRVGMIIGSNTPAASEPLEVISAPTEGEPYAIRTRLGWAVCGVVGGRKQKVSVGKIGVKEVELNKLVSKAFDVGFEQLGDCKEGMSEEDNQWMEIVDGGYRKVLEKPEIPLPLRDNTSELPSNREYVLRRTLAGRRKIEKNLNLKIMYDQNFHDMLRKGYAEPVPAGASEDNVWYIPHFHVSHPLKPDKVRVVFDCAARVGGMCLNDVLIPGPKLGNELLDVILRFRGGEFAYTADIESMFYQVRVPVEHRDYLRFFWLREDGSGSIGKYRMTVHLFGAASSPSVASYALQKVVDCEGVTKEAKETILRNFYVDDCLKSGTDLGKLGINAKEVKELCGEGGFRLCKYAGLQGMESYIPELDVADSTIKTLGILWDRSTDCLGVDVSELGESIPKNRRELLSRVASVFDPLGIMAPTVLRGRQLLQQTLRRGSSQGWDEPLGDTICGGVKEWIRMLLASSHCIARNILGSEVCGSAYELHVFSDASGCGYGAVAYLRVSSLESVVCRFVMGKARVNPLKDVSIPRLELVAAVLATELRIKVLEQLGVVPCRVVMWTDSLTVLRYLRNVRDRFLIFVANRITIIKERSRVEEWRYVNSKLNPADDVSRCYQSDRWIKGPEFLLKDECMWPKEPMQDDECGVEDKLEVKKVFNTTIVNDYVGKIIQYFSTWNRLLRAVVVWLKFVNFIQIKEVADKNITVESLNGARVAILKYVQRKYFSEDLIDLQKRDRVKNSSRLVKLDVVLQDSLIKVGGRLRNADVLEDERHPVLLPSNSVVTSMIIRDCHESMGHLGSLTVLGQIRKSYWIVNGLSTVKRVLHSCVVCRKVRGQRMSQKMADLPTERVTAGVRAFESTGVDCFGPFWVKIGRRREKRYGVIFTCLTMRAIHLEVAYDLSTDSMFNAVRRFQARRGNVRTFISDNGTNLVGVRKEMVGALVNKDLFRKTVDRGVEWKLNPPGASHHGGAWERMIRTVRRVLEAVIGRQGLSEDTLRTVFCEAELAVNSRPLSVVSSDSQEWEVLTPNLLLTLGSCSVPHTDDDAGLYSRKRWRQVQHLANQFWSRWRREYRTSLQERRKWYGVRKNLKVDDIVLVVDEGEARCHWPLARVVDVKPGVDGLVRTVLVRSRNKIYRRPITKLILLLDSEDML